MSLESTAQSLEITDGPESSLVVIDDSLPSEEEIHLQPITIHDDQSAVFEVFPSEEHQEFEIVFDRIPGAPGVEPEIEPEEEILEVVEEPSNKEDENEAKDPKAKKWDWAKRIKDEGSSGFLSWIKEMNDAIPKHSGKDTAGLDRAKSYLEKLDDEISKAMRQDLDGDLDSYKIEEIRVEIENGINRLQESLDSKKKGKKKKKTAQDRIEGLVKEGQKIAGVHGVVVTVPLLISRIARVCINGTISAGHDIEEIYKDQVARFKLTEREQAEVMQLISDMGFPLRQDRGYMPEDEVTEGYDWAQNFKG